MIVTSGAEPQFTSQDVHSVLRVIGISCAIAVITHLWVFHGDVPPFVFKLVNWVGYIVGSVRRIADSTADPALSEFVLCAQWLFAPFQLLAWMIFAPPWSARAREVARKKARNLKTGQKLVLFAFYVFMGAWLLGDFGVLDFPTLYNGGYVYPPDEAVPQLHVIYTSRAALTVYAWLSPLVEVIVLWAFVFLTLNLGTYLTPIEDSSEG